MPINEPDFKRILYINLEDNTYDYAVNPDMWYALGGIGLGYLLIEENIENSLFVLTTGPLNGYFPYVSKAALLYINEFGVQERFGGGSIGSLLNMAGVDGIVVTGTTDKYLRIYINERDVVINEVSHDDFFESSDDFTITSKNAMSKKYFSFGDMKDDNGLALKGGVAISVNNTINVDMSNFYDYEKLYAQILEDYKRLTVEPRNNPSCLGCPMGCDFSHLGEDDIHSGLLVRSLIACGYAQDIYKNIPTVFACLNSIGYNYQHSDLEKLPEIIGKKKAEINQLFTVE